MTGDDFHAAAIALPAATFDVKWGADRVYSVGGKMFAVAGPASDGVVRYSMKASEASFDQLIEEGVAVPAPYMARAKWISFPSGDAVPDEQFVAYLKQAHAIVGAKLPKKVQAELGLTR